MIPTLLLTYVLETRLSERDKDQPPLPGLLWVSASVGVMVVGEMLALAGVAVAGSSGSARVVTIACGVGLFLVVAPFVFGHMESAFGAAASKPMAHPMLTGCRGGFRAIFGVLVAVAPIVAAVVVAIVAF